MTDLRQAAQALLNRWDSPLWKNGSTADAIADLRTALKQQAEPIGWLDGNDKLAEFMHRDLKAEHDKRGSATPKDFTIPVYTTLPQRKPLTDEEIGNLLPDDNTPMSLGEAFLKFARLIEAAHGIKEGT